MQDAVNGNIIVNILWIPWLFQKAAVRKESPYATGEECYQHANLTKFLNQQR
jgi:hypothetical protein